MKPPKPVTFTPIGIVRTPFKERVEAPRQAVVKRDVEARIELCEGKGFEFALEDLAGFEYLWIITWFHQNESWRPKVLPPRGEGVRRGVFATRSPYRPNPIGISAVKLLGVEGLVIRIAGADFLDETPVLDIKPYVAYADAFPEAKSGWLDAREGDAIVVADPKPRFSVAWSERAREELAWLRARSVDLESPIADVLSIGPAPHPYRRIKREGDRFRLAFKAFRVMFRVEGDSVSVDEIVTGYRESELASPSDPERILHRDFAAAFAR